eukprot:3090683-Amphidinium_carterae.1
MCPSTISKGLLSRAEAFARDGSLYQGVAGRAHYQQDPTYAELLATFSISPRLTSLYSKALVSMHGFVFVKGALLKKGLFLQETVIFFEGFHYTEGFALYQEDLTLQTCWLLSLYRQD